MVTRELSGYECLFHTSEFEVGGGTHWATPLENEVGFSSSLLNLNLSLKLEINHDVTVFYL